MLRVTAVGRHSTSESIRFSFLASTLVADLSLSAASFPVCFQSSSCSQVSCKELANFTVSNLAGLLAAWPDGQDSWTGSSRGTVNTEKHFDLWT